MEIWSGAVTAKQKDDHTLPKHHEKKEMFPGDYPINHSWADTDRLQSLKIVLCVPFRFNRLSGSLNDYTRGFSVIRNSLCIVT